MATDLEPTVGQWYYDAESGCWLEVVDVDIDEELVVVQSQEGEEDELSLDNWYALDVEPGEPPDEDWLEDDEDEEEPDKSAADADKDIDEDREEEGGYQRRNQSDWARRSPDDIYPDEEDES